jgi:hypothetical protein
MAYVPLAAEDLAPIGLPANDAAYSQLIDSHDALYELTGPPIACGGGRETVPIWSETGGAFVDHAKWRVYGNLDALPVSTLIIWRSLTAGTAEARITIDGVDTATVTTVAGAYATVLIQVTPTTPLDPSEVVLALRHTGAAGTTQVCAIVSTYGGGTLAAGVRPSGFVRGAALLDAANGPIASEHIERLQRGPSWIARDRRATILTLLNDHTDVARYHSVTTLLSTAGAVCARFLLPAGDHAARLYRVAVLLRGVSPICRVQIGSQKIDFAGAGWQHGTLRLPGGSVMPGTLYLAGLVVAGPGTGDLSTLQILREPS